MPRRVWRERGYMTPPRETLFQVYARAAKELVAGMRERVKRDPDVADYTACFERVYGEWIVLQALGKSEGYIKVPGANL